MPNDIGMSNAFATVGASLSSFAFATSLNLIVNPDNQNADIVVQEGQGYVNYFSDEVALRMPYWWLYMGTFCVVVTLVCNFVMTENTNTENKSIDAIASIISSENVSSLSGEQKPKSQDQNLEILKKNISEKNLSFASFKSFTEIKSSQNAYFSILSARCSLIESEKSSMRKSISTKKSDASMNEPLNEMNELKEIYSKAGGMS